VKLFDRSTDECRPQRLYPFNLIDSAPRKPAFRRNQSDGGCEAYQCPATQTLKC